MTERELAFGNLVGRTSAFNIAVTGFGAATGLLLARWLGPSGRGEYAAISAWFGLSLVIFELGLASATVYFASRDRQRAMDVVKTTQVLLVALGIVTAAATVLVVLLVRGGSPSDSAALLLVAACILAAFAGTPALFALQALDIPRWNLVRVLQPIVYLILVCLAATTLGTSLALVVAALAVSITIQSGYGWVLLARKGLPSGRFSRQLVPGLLHFGLRNMASTAPNSLNGRFDQLALAFLVPSAALGQYAVAVSLSLLAGPLAAAFGHVAFPALAGGAGNREDTVGRSMKGAFIVAVVGVLAVVCIAPWIVRPLFGPGYEDVPKLLLILAPGAIFFIVNLVQGDLIRGLGRPGSVAWAEWLGVCVTLIGLLVLVPRLGVYGAALTSSVTYVGVFVILQRARKRALANAATDAGP